MKNEPNFKRNLKFENKNPQSPIIKLKNFDKFKNVIRADLKYNVPNGLKEVIKLIKDKQIPNFNDKGYRN